MPLAYTALLAYALLMLGLAQKDGLPDLAGLALVTLSWLVGVVGLVFSGRRAKGRSPRGLFLVLLAVLVVQAVYLAGRTREVQPDLALGGASLVPFAAWVALALLFALLGATPWLARVRIFLAVAVCLAAGAWAVRCWHESDRQRGFTWLIDVPYLQQTAAAELLSGRNPYSHLYDNVYHPRTHFYGARTLRDGKVVSFPYPPATLAVDLVGYGLGDVRLGHLLALAAGCVFLVLAGRRAGLPAGHPAELSVLLLLLHPCTGKVLVFGWTEPLLFCAAALCLWTLLGPPGWPQWLGTGLLLSVKQFAPLWLPSLALSGRLTMRAALGGCLTALALTLPFVLWDPAGFWQGVVVTHLDSPFRADCLSVPATVFALTHRQTSSGVAFAAAAVVPLLHLCVRRPGLAQATFAGAVLFQTFFYFGKAANVNYYWFAGALLLAAVPLAAAESLPGQ